MRHLEAMQMNMGMVNGMMRTMCRMFLCIKTECKFIRMDCD